ncbi:hypothetical protein BGZ60DRAFT_408332 [Tricladium varicosporioides]|nr:hypothetical protein BGZ60DRAFT_408332 [Hymenoscyphus varicosporioides]
MAATQETSPRLKRAQALLDAYAQLSPDALVANFSSNFTHQILPASLMMPGRNREEFARHASMITSVFTKFAMEPQQIFEDHEKNVVVIYAKMVGELAGDLGEWVNECFMVLEMTEENGEVKIESIKEFVDSARAKALPEKLKVLKDGGKGDFLRDVGPDTSSLSVRPGPHVTMQL